MREKHPHTPAHGKHLLTSGGRVKSESPKRENGGGGAPSGDPPPHPPLPLPCGGGGGRGGVPAPRPGAVARAAHVLPRRPPHPRRGRRPPPRRPQVPPQGRPLQGEPRGALREGSGAGQPGHGGGGDGDRGGVQARDPRPGGRQDRLAPARHRVRRQPPHGRLT